ncbi:TetR/AcrR family transcriptional regulator [Culicoidibacter larvae]|uniref:TetR family transcriptional regulator n=1 Tax=Culicoidibacter larvae TaxID=2579976 RepID=A0A5R8Q9B4_9FIRM|nr:TetR/AcrR family transcriptional regulator C-terminal domain-containing protein [Culicoidibacter larvae]TLG72513.1 TetR family transcriptional regulator [Culicoidibacter larvae]
MRDLRKNKTKTLLANALMKLIEEKRFDDIKLYEICDNALVHKTSFYNHFEDKYDLLNYLIQELQKDIFMNLKETDDLELFYIIIAKAYINNIKQNAKFYKMILSGNDIASQILLSNIHNDIQTKLDHFQTTVPNNYMLQFYISGVIAVINEWVLNGMKESDTEILQILTDI